MSDGKTATWIWIILIVGSNIIWLTLYLWMSVHNEIPPCSQ